MPDTGPKPRVKWTPEETILALDLYLQHDGEIAKTDASLSDLSTILRRMAGRDSATLATKYRNVDGVYMKLMNLRASDPRRKGAGLPHGSDVETAVWADYGHDPKRLADAASELLRDIALPVFFEAVESKPAMRAAHLQWRAKFAEGLGAPFGRFNGPVLWAPDQALWANFIEEDPSSHTSFETSLGVSTNKFRENRLVEINLPFTGDQAATQGILADDGVGGLWVLHQGGLNTRAGRVHPGQFARATGIGGRVLVKFKSGKTRPYYCVANLNADPTVLRAQMGAFLARCERMRAHESLGAVVAGQMREVEARAAALFPELKGAFTIPARDSIEGRRWHADVSEALTTVLQGLKLTLSNQRIGALGADLYTACESPRLFEIKTSATAADVQQGIGQLMIYEHLLRRPHTKILVLPKSPSTQLLSCLKALKIRLLEYQFGANGDVHFDRSAVRKAIG